MKTEEISKKTRDKYRESQVNGSLQEEKEEKLRRNVRKKYAKQQIVKE